MCLQELQFLNKTCVLFGGGMPQCMCGSQRTILIVAFLLYYVGLQDQTQVSSFGSRHPYMLSCLIGWKLCLLFYSFIGRITRRLHNNIPA